MTVRVKEPSNEDITPKLEKVTMMMYSTKIRGGSEHHLYRGNSTY